MTGPSGSGKTYATLKLIKYANEMIAPPPERIIWCYGIFQDSFDHMVNVEFHEGLPDESMFDGKQRTLCIIDDLMSEADDKVEKLFTKISHHKSVSVLFLTQNLFYKSKPSRTISLNSHYIMLFKNVRDATQISTLARQMYPSKSKFMIEAFRDATSNPYGYLLIDMCPQTEDTYRLRTNIFPGEAHYVYVPK
jgi:hypothetical protein